MSIKSLMQNPWMQKSWVRVVITLIISLMGGLVGFQLDLPAGLLIGGAIAVTFAALLGVNVSMPDRMRNVGFVIIGMTLGTNVARDSLTLMGQWPVTLIALLIALIVMVFASAFMLQHLFKLERGTAYLCSFPGHLSFVLAMAESGYGNSRQIAVIQSIRILLLTLCLPFFVKLTSSVPIQAISSKVPMEWGAIIILAGACVTGSYLFSLLKFPAAYVLGSMVVATAGKLMGLYEGSLPFVLTAVGFVIMGGLLGSRFTGLTLKELGRYALAGSAVTLICVAVVSGAAFASAMFTDMPYGQIWLGLAPGALEVMGALGIALGFDTAFVAAHHTARMFLLTIFVPAVSSFIGKKPEAD